MAIKLDLLIELDSKGAVAGVKALNSEITNLDKQTKTASASQGSLLLAVTAGATAANYAAKAVDFLASTFIESAKAAMEAESQQSKLNIILRRGGEDIKSTNDKISEFAETMEYLTGVDDDQIKSLEILARQWGANTDQIHEMIKGAIGLTEIGGDLEGNLKAITLAYNGNWRALGSLIPAIKTANSDSERMDILQRAMAEGFEISTEAMKTSAGALRELANAWDDFKKAAGVGIVQGAKLIDAALLGNKKMAQDVFRAMVVEEQRFQDSLDRFNKSTALEFKASLNQLGFIDVEADIAAADSQMKQMEPTWEAAAKKAEELKKKLQETGEALAQAGRDVIHGTSLNNAWTESVGGQIKATIEFNKNLSPPVANLSNVGGQLKKTADEMEAAREKTASLAGGMVDLAGVLDSLGSPFGDLLGFSGQLIGSFNDLNSATNFGEMLSGFSGMMGAVIGFAKVLNGLLPDSLKKAIQAQNDWMDLNEEMIDQIKKVAIEIAKESDEFQKLYDAMGKMANMFAEDIASDYNVVHWATSKSLDEIIKNTDLTVDSFDQMTIRLRAILNDFDEGMATQAEVEREMGDAFEQLIIQAKRLGMEGSNEIITMFEDLANRGMNVLEITQYINEELKTGLEGYKAYLEGDFSTATIGVYESLLAYEKKVEENKALVNGIQGITQALISLSNTTRLTEEEFDQFEIAASDAFNKLTAQGFTSKESLVQMAPMLARMIFLQKEYGFTIDDSTQALIDKAKAENINLENYKSQEEIFGEMATSLKDLVDIFKNVFPNAIAKTTDAFGILNKTVENFDIPDINSDLITNRKPPGKSAAIGYYSSSLPSDTLIQAHQGEEVMISPRGRVAGDDGPRGGGASINIDATWNINVSPKSGIDPQDLVAGLKIAINDNLRSIADDITTAVSRRMN